MAQQSEIDTKRYDRQIRLWGLDTQRGLVGARILVLGVNGLANEIAKNLVLAGVGHVRFQDPGCVTAADLEAGGLFSVSEAQLGVGRAEAIAATLKAMNPSVELTYSCAAVAELSAELLQTYHFIVGTRGVEAVREITACTALLERHGGGENADPQSRVEPPAPKRHRANGDSGPALARSNGTHEVVPMRPTDAPPLPKFLAAGTLGLEGFCFFDCGCLSAIIPPIKKQGKAAEGGAASSTDEAAAQPHTEQALYPTVSAAARVEWAALTPRVPRLYYALQLLDAVMGPAATGAKPAAKEDGAHGAPAAAELRAQLGKLRNKLLESAASNAEAGKLVNDAYLEKVVAAHAVELAPVCAIVGGMIAAEAIKLISGKDRPINNVLFFDGHTSDGVVQRLGPSFDCPHGLDKGDFKELRTPAP